VLTPVSISSAIIGLPATFAPDAVVPLRNP
jgi:hypothetical protein